MNTGSMLADIDRIARALERIANALEQNVYGTTSDDLRLAKEQLRRDMEEVAPPRWPDPPPGPRPNVSR